MDTHAKPAPRKRAERLGFRVDEATKALIQRAADLDHRNVTDFCLAAITQAARKTVAEHETITLGAADSAVLFDVLMNPPEPNERLRRAMEAHDRLVVMR
jgi:uncharacterized protein (DUF1778 family)